MVGHGPAHGVDVVGVEQAIDVLHARDDFILGEPQLFKRLGCLARDVAGDDVVLPQVGPGGLQGQLQPLVVQVCPPMVMTSFIPSVPFISCVGAGFRNQAGSMPPA